MSHRNTTLKAERSEMKRVRAWRPKRDRPLENPVGAKRIEEEKGSAVALRDQWQPQIYAKFISVVCRARPASPLPG